MDRLEHLEFLSKLKFSQEERESFDKEFENILKFVDQIRALDLSSQQLDKDAPIPLDQLREDEPKNSMAQQEVLFNAPKQKDGCYQTPLVVE